MGGLTARERAWSSISELHELGRIPVPFDALEHLADRGWLGPNGLDELVCPPLHVTPWPDVEGGWFDVAEVELTLMQFASLRHTKGRKHANRPFHLLPWQIVWIAAPIFGWRHTLDEELAEQLEVDAGSRIIRTALIEIARKNGKSSVCSALALKLLCGDGEPSAEVYAAARDKDQAKLVFQPAKEMAQRSPQLAQQLQARGQIVRHPATLSFFRPLSGAADAQHGLNAHGVVIDELHTHPTRDLLDVLTTSTGARTQPLVVSITTADDGRQGTVYDEQHEGIIDLEAGRVDPEPATYGVIFAAAEDADPFDEVTWWKANPSLPHTPSIGYLRTEATKARNRPAYFPSFSRLHLNQRLRAGAGMFDMEGWAKNAAPVIDVEELAGRECHGGIVLTSSVDLACVVWVFPGELVGFDGQLHHGYEVVARSFLPEGALHPDTGRRSRQAGMFREWADQGWLTLTDGDAIDYATIEGQIRRDLDEFAVVDAAYVRFGQEASRQRLAEMRPPRWKDEDEWVFPLTTSIDRMAAPTDELYRVLELGVFHTGGNPVLRWCASNAVSKVDAEKRVKPDAGNSRDSIAGVTGVVMGLAAAIRERPTFAAPTMDVV